MKKVLLSLILVGALSVQVAVAQDVKAEMKEVVEFLASDELKGRETGTPEERKAAKYIAKEFKKLGLSPAGDDKYYQDFTYTPKPKKIHGHVVDSTQKLDPITGRNVVAFLDKGSDFTVVIGAHYDHLGMGGPSSRYKGEPAVHNGADDNASGVALMLALAKHLKDINSNHNFLFLAFSGEEKGLWGSNYYMKNPTIDTASISYMLNFDMVGRLGPQYKLAIYGTGTSPSFNETLKRANDPAMFHLMTKESGVGPSDHTSFYLKNIPVMHFFTGQHEDYHKPSDDADKINYEGMELIYTFVNKVIVDLDNEQTLAFTKTKDEESRKAPKYSVTLGVVPDYLFDGKGMRLDGVSDGKPAMKAGMKAGDVVVKMGDIEIADMMGYMKALSQFKKGEATQVVVVRDGKEITLDVVF